MTSIEERFVDLPDGQMFTLQFGQGPLLIFLHATGMCARLYVPLLAPLAARHRIVACDARGHGRTRLPLLDRLDDWKPYRADMLALIAALGERPHLLAGHSFGASTLFELAAANPGLTDHVILIDPPMVPFAHADAWRRLRDSGEPIPNPLAEQAQRRRSVFAGVDEARAAYRDRGVFRGWPEEALDAYLQGGLRPDGSGGVELCCSPAWEALSYRGVPTTFEESMRRTRTPFTLLAAEHGSPFLPEDEERVRELHPEAVVRRFPGTGHFLPVTHPELVQPYLDA